MTFTTFDVITRRSSAALISGYQKHISPKKGFSCAYRMLHGGESCSAYIKRAILEQGLLEAIQASRQRFQACKAANQILKARIQAIDSSNEAQAQEGSEEKQQPRRQNQTDRCHDGVNCADVGCQSLECMMPCDSGMDCGAPDCSGPDCCSGADFCSCGG